jgi:hypothetical protein
MKIQLCNVNRQTTEAEESPLLTFVTRKRLVKTLDSNSHCEEQLLTDRIDWEDLLGVNFSVEISKSLIIICQYDLLPTQTRLQSLIHATILKM